MRIRGGAYNLSGRFRKFWRAWLDIGINPSSTTEQVKQTHLINAMRLVAAAFMGLVAFLNARAGAWHGVTINTGACLTYLFLTFPLIRGSFELARRMFFVAGFGTVIGMHLIYGKAVNSYFALFPLVGAFTLLYGHSDAKQTRWLLLSLILAVAAYNWGSFLITPLQHPRQPKVLSGLALNIIATFLIFRWLKIENIAAEASLKQERDHLAGLNARLADARRKAEDANQFKDKFLAKISHELRTPMNGVLGAAQILQDTELSGEQKDLIAVITTSGQQQLAIINDLLDFAKIQAGKITIESTPVSLRDLVYKLIQTFTVLCEHKQIAFHWNIAEDIPSVVMTDPVKIRQIILNLMNNAAKFTSRGSITMRVYYEKSITYFEVADTGIGMNEDQIQKLFNPFQQGDDSINRRFGGTGLGLSIVNELVNLMGGTIVVKSAPNQGSTFLIGIKFEVANDTMVEIATTDLAPISIPEGLRILVAEDNNTNIIVIKRLLKKISAHVTLVTDGESAIDAYRANRYDIILMDLHMPIMDGIEAGRRVRDLEITHNSPRTPMLALTADVQPEVIIKCKAIGFDDVIEKPINRQVLYKALERIALEKHQRPAS